MSIWSIAYADYELIVDRRSLTYQLTETKTQTLWANDLPLGWIELEDRETAAVSRYDFGALRCLSVSEKSGPQGKRILFGLDIHGIPIDLYLICSQREIQIQLEANRDSKTHRISAFGLLPGLCSVAEDTDGYRIVPFTQATYLLSSNADSDRIYRNWEELAMPFIGAVRKSAPGIQSALGLFTDSAYLDVSIHRQDIELIYRRDPERRRLDLRCLIFPQGDSLSIARAYREKIIAENGHITLRKKSRESIALHDFLEGGVGDFIPVAHHLSPEDRTNRWEAMEERLSEIAQFHAQNQLIVLDRVQDWAAIAADGWLCETNVTDAQLTPALQATLPLLATIYRDCVVPFAPLRHPFATQDLLRALVHLALPRIDSVPDGETMERGRDAVRLLKSAYHLTFSAFLTAHRFLTPDYKVEEAIYSDKTRVIINQSESEIYETEEFSLPPLGFYMRHSQMEAHDALRVGEERFAIRAWRIRQAQDGKSLESSEAVEWKVFPA